jgi:hypothetical protein
MDKSIVGNWKDKVDIIHEMHVIVLYKCQYTYDPNSFYLFPQIRITTQPLLASPSLSFQHHHHVPKLNQSKF